MSDEAREVCPACEPDPEGLIVFAWCGAHSPSLAGPDDHLANPLATPMPGLADGGEDGAAWCDAIHRGRP